MATAHPFDLSQFPFLSPPRQADEVARLGRYRILGLLGNGGMGAVFRAEEPSLKRPVAIKVMRPELASDPQAKARFLREAEAQAKVEHEHIVVIYEADEHHGAPFIAMQYLKGPTLARIMQDERPMSQQEVIRIGYEIAQGLAAAHTQGLIHRDIKPGNIILEGQARRVKLLDFGWPASSSQSHPLNSTPRIRRGSTTPRPPVGSFSARLSTCRPSKQRRMQLILERTCLAWV